MAKKSLFKQHPTLNEEFCKLIKDERLTCKQIAEALTDFLEEQGIDLVVTERVVQWNAQSYKARMAKRLERERIEQQVFSDYVAMLGDNPKTDTVQLVSLLIEGATARIAIEMDDNGESDVKKIKELAQINKMAIETKRTVNDIIKKAKEEAAKQAEKALREAGIDDVTITVVERRIVS